MNTIPVKIYMPPELENQMKEFESYYDPLVWVSCPDKKMKHKPQRERVCRFCRRSYEEKVVTFGSEAHIIPQFMGNRYLTSDFECDQCNKKFSQFENDLRNYLGIIPTATLTRGSKNQLKNFTSQKGEIVAEKTDRISSEGDFVQILASDPESTAIKMDYEAQTFRAQFLKSKYTPYNVYKAILKIAVSCLSDEVMQKYQNLLLYLNNPENVLPAPLPTLYLTENDVRYGLKEPMIFFYQKRRKTDPVPSHIMLLYFQNLIFQVFLPLHTDDRFFYEGGRMNFVRCPPLNLQPDNTTLNIRFHTIDFSSTDIITDDSQTLNIKFNAAENDMYYRDTKTGELQKLESHPSSIKGIIIFPSNTEIPDNF